MESDRRLRWIVLILIVLLVPLAYWLWRPGRGVPSIPTEPPGPPVKEAVAPHPSVVHVTMDAEGGFAYVKLPGANEIDIAFLKSTSVAGCSVHQMGVMLHVDNAQLVEPASQPVDGFDLAGAALTFGDFGTTTAPAINAQRGPRPAPPGRPANPMDDAQWSDLRFVASISEGYPLHLKANWLDEVDGRFRLSRGTLVGLHPTDIIAQRGVWEFKATSGSPAAFKQAMTDATRYTVDVPGAQVIITLEGAKSKLQRIVLKPNANLDVKLKLVGVHDDAPTTIPLGTELTHYCAYYELLEPHQDPKDQLRPHYAGDPTKAGPGQGSPGGLCPGDYVP